MMRARLFLEGLPPRWGSGGGTSRTHELPLVALNFRPLRGLYGATSDRLEPVLRGTPPGAAALVARRPIHILEEPARAGVGGVLAEVVQSRGEVAMSSV